MLEMAAERQSRVLCPCLLRRPSTHDRASDVRMRSLMRTAILTQPTHHAPPWKHTHRKATTTTAPTRTNERAPSSRRPDPNTNCSLPSSASASSSVCSRACVQDSQHHHHKQQQHKQQRQQHKPAMGKDVGEIRRVLQVFDQTAAAPSARQAVGSLQSVTVAVGKNPDAYDLLEEPSEAEAWRSAGGESHCENLDFAERLAARWQEVLARPDFANAGFDKGELAELKASLTTAFQALLDAGLELGGDDALEELEAKLDELAAAAPEASSSSSDGSSDGGGGGDDSDEDSD